MPGHPAWHLHQGDLQSKLAKLEVGRKKYGKIYNTMGKCKINSEEVRCLEEVLPLSYLKACPVMSVKRYARTILLDTFVAHVCWKIWVLISTSIMKALQEACQQMGRPWRIEEIQENQEILTAQSAHFIPFHFFPSTSQQPQWIHCRNSV